MRLLLATAAVATGLVLSAAPHAEACQPEYCPPPPAHVREAFGTLGVAEVTVLPCASRRGSTRPRTVAATERATGVFRTGGDQARVARAFGGSDADRCRGRAGTTRVRPGRVRGPNESPHR